MFADGKDAREDRRRDRVAETAAMWASLGFGPNHKAIFAITADSRTLMGFLAKDRSLVSASLRRKIRLKGSSRRLVAFGRRFRSGASGGSSGAEMGMRHLMAFFAVDRYHPC
jgi:hypothetical protein